MQDKLQAQKTRLQEINDLESAARLWPRAVTARNRSVLTRLGIWPGMSAAGVPGRRE